MKFNIEINHVRKSAYRCLFLHVLEGSTKTRARRPPNSGDSEQASTLSSSFLIGELEIPDRSIFLFWLYMCFLR